MAERKKRRIALPVIVEGKYDKITILSHFSADVFVTDGFSIFNRKEKQALFRRIAGERGVLLLTDPDGGGKQIRSFLLGVLPPDRVKVLYVPKIAGKERRKSAPSKAGVLGVEGMSGEILERVFAPYLVGEQDETSDVFAGKPREMITKVDFYEDKFSGCPDAVARRALLAEAFSLPPDMTANALLAALNLIADRAAYRAAAAAISRPEERE